MTTPIAKKPSPISKTAVLKQLGDDDQKAHVKEETVITKTYVEDKPDKEKDKDDKDESAVESRAFDRQAVPVHFADKSAPQDRLAQMFSDIKESEEYEGEMFVALITRLQDLMTDNFRRPCMQSISFAPLQITSSYFLNFIPLIQKHNGNSGGRFNIVICDQQGEPLDIGINNLVVSDPIVEEKPNAPDTSNTDTLALVDRIMQQSDQRFAELVKLMRENAKEDEFTALAKEKLRQDILNPKERDAFNPEKMIENVMTSVAVSEAMAKGFAKMFDRGEAGTDREKGLLETLLSNELLVDRASQLVESVVNNVAVIANNVATRPAQPQAPAQPQPHYGQPNTGYSPLPNPTPQPSENNEINMTKEEQDKLTLEIIAELEADTPLNDDNVFINNLKEKYPQVYQGLLVACKFMPFETLLEQLENGAPQAFDNFYKDTGEKDSDGEAIYELNERGQKVEARLREFYEFMKTKQQ